MNRDPVGSVEVIDPVGAIGVDGSRSGHQHLLAGVQRHPHRGVRGGLAGENGSRRALSTVQDGDLSSAAGVLDDAAKRGEAAQRAHAEVVDACAGRLPLVDRVAAVQPTLAGAREPLLLVHEVSAEDVAAGLGAGNRVLGTAGGFAGARELLGRAVTGETRAALDQPRDATLPPDAVRADAGGAATGAVALVGAVDGLGLTGRGATEVVAVEDQPSATAIGREPRLGTRRLPGDATLRPVTAHSCARAASVRAAAADQPHPRIRHEHALISGHGDAVGAPAPPDACTPPRQLAAAQPTGFGLRFTGDQVGAIADPFGLTPGADGRRLAGCLPVRGDTAAGLAAGGPPCAGGAGLEQIAVAPRGPGRAARGSAAVAAAITFLDSGIRRATVRERDGRRAGLNAGPGEALSGWAADLAGQAAQPARGAARARDADPRGITASGAISRAARWQRRAASPQGQRDRGSGARHQRPWRLPRHLPPLSPWCAPPGGEGATLRKRRTGRVVCCCAQQCSACSAPGV